MAKPTNAYKTNKKLYRWQFIQSVAILVSSVLFFIMVESIAHPNEDISAYVARGLGMLIPMAVILGVINYYFSKKTFNYVNALEQGLANVADGSFRTRLDVSSAGPLDSAYDNFNKMATELEQTQLLRNDFINNFSHEFKTPIASINGFALLLLEKDIRTEDKIRYLKIIADESARLANLADNTILLSKLDSQQIMPKKKPYAIDEQLRQCSILLSPQWQKKKITLTCDLAAVIYNGNSEIMQHVWLNTINNAIKFTPENGEITIVLKDSPDKITIQIADNGTGMNEETLSHIFEKYYQSDKSKTTVGLGLGLPIVARIIVLSGGTIVPTSKFGGGTTFTITLPK